MRFAWTDDFCYADMYAMPDSPAIIAKIRAAAQGFASIGGKVEQTDEVWEDFFPGFIATASGIGHNYSRHELPKPPMAELKRALDLRGRNWERFRRLRSEEHTSELQSLMRISYAVFCLTQKKHSEPRTCTNKHQINK